MTLLRYVICCELGSIPLAGIVFLLQSDNQSDGDEGSVGAKRKGLMTEEDKKRRRQEINRQSARRIRERRSHEMERLKQQVQTYSALFVSSLCKVISVGLEAWCS